MEEKERYEYHEVSNEVETYECYWDNQECCELFDDKAVLNRLNEQDKRIKELEKRLAENNEFFNAFACKDFNEFKDFISTFMLAPHEEQTLIRELKQQLEDTEESYNNTMRYLNKTRSELLNLPKKIVEDIKQQIFNYFKVKNIEEYEKLSLIDALFTADTVIEILDTILKKYGGENEYIQYFLSKGFKSYNVAGGGQIDKAGDVGERLEVKLKNYKTGKNKGYEKAREQVKVYFDKYLDYSIKGKPTKIKERKMQEFADFIADTTKAEEDGE